MSDVIHEQVSLLLFCIMKGQQTDNSYKYAFCGFAEIFNLVSVGGDVTMGSYFCNFIR